MPVKKEDPVLPVEADDSRCPALEDSIHAFTVRGGSSAGQEVSGTVPPLTVLALRSNHDVTSKRLDSVSPVPLNYVDVPADFVEETRSVNAEIEAALDTVPAVNTLAPEESRRIRAEGGGIFGPIVRSDKARDSTIPGPSGDLPVRIVSPDDPSGVYLHIHGGGWTLGAADQQDRLLTTLSEEAGVAVVSVEYRLGPEAPYPAAADDCEAAACWLVEHAVEQFGTAKLLIGGESAGAHLSAVTLSGCGIATALRRSTA